jgi:hypothetical protein
MFRKKLLGAAFGVTLLAGLVPAAAASAAVQPDTAPVVTWQVDGGLPSQNGNYLGIYESGKANGDYANTYKWENVSNQKWYSILEAPGEYAFENVNSGKCLEDNGGNVSARVDQWTCEANHDNELWSEYYNGSYWQLQNVYLWDDAADYVDLCSDGNGDGWLHFYNLENGLGANCAWH